MSFGRREKCASSRTILRSTETAGMSNDKAWVRGYAESPATLERQFAEGLGAPVYPSSKGKSCGGAMRRQSR